MRQFIRSVILFALLPGTIMAILAIVSSMYDNLDRHSSDNNNIISLQTKSLYDSLDVLFIGNSYCYSSIVPEMLDSIGVSSLNLGIATAGVQFYELVWADYVAHVSQPPKEVFIMVSPTTFTGYSDNFEAYPIHRYLERPLSNFRVVFRFGRYSDLIPLYRKSVSKGFAHVSGRSRIGEQAVRISHSHHRGFHPSNVVFNDSVAVNDSPLYMPMRDEVFRDSALEGLLRFALSVEKGGVGITFFELPTYRLSEFLNSQFLARYEEALAQIGARHRLVRIDSDLFSPAHFRNFDHLNSSGAIVATRLVRDYLAKRPNAAPYSHAEEQGHR